MNHSSGSTLHINETKIKTMSGNFMHSAAPYLVSIVTENLLGFKIDGPTKMVDIHLRKLVIVDRGQHAKLHCESEKQPGHILVFYQYSFPLKLCFNLFFFSCMQVHLV
jgi:hypothetical protein